MATLMITTSEDTANRLHALVAESGDLDIALTRLLDRDGHDHLTPHRCPTCVRLESGVPEEIPGQDTLF